jgi:predicted secreted Zn-dependent protease
MFPSTFTGLRPLYGVTAIFQNQKRNLWLAATLLMLLVSIFSVAIRLPQIMPAATLVAKVSAQTAISAVPPATPPTPTTALSAPAATPPAAPEPQACIPTAYNLPSTIDLTNQTSGLTQTIDATAYYRIYGNTSAQIKTQLSQCPPIAASTDGASFAAETGSKLNWQYSSTSDTSGTCRISGVEVGLHINMVLPVWQPTSDAASGLAANWQNLISSLTVHENGHVAIYQQYANQLLHDLQALPATSCTSIAASVDAVSAANITALNTANEAYDAATNHGVTQGAVLR